MGLSSKLLDSRDLPEIFREIYLQGLTGVLFAERLKYKRSVYFLKGAPIFATSNLSEDKIGKILFSNGKITMDQLMAALDKAKQEQKRLGSVLVELSFISAKELFEAVVAQVEQIVHSLFDVDWRDAKYRFDVDAAFGDEVIKLSIQPIDLLMEGIRRSYNPELVALNVGDLRLGYRLTGVRQFDVDRLKLSAEEKAVVAMLDGARSIVQLVQESGAEKQRVLLLLYVLKALGLAEAGATPPAVAAAAEEEADDPAEAIDATFDLSDADLPDEIVEAAKTSAPVATAAPAKAAAPAKQISVEELKQQTLRLKQQNYYARLGIGQDATAAALVAAYSSLRRKYETELPVTLRPAGKQAQQLIIDAYKGLALEGNRKVYDALLAAGGTPQEIESKFRLRMGAARFDEGKRAWESHDLEEAERAFRDSIEMEPSKADYYFALALTLASKEHGAPGYDEVEALFTKAVALQSDHPRGYYYLGTLFRHRGEAERAAEAFRRALTLDAGYEPAREGLAACGQTR